MVYMPEQCRVQDIADKRGLSASADTCDHSQDTQRKFHIDIFQIVLHGAFHLNRIYRSPFFPDISGSLSGKILQSQRPVYLLLADLRTEPAFEDYLSSVHSGFRTDIYEQIRRPHDLFVMFYHNHGIPYVPELSQHRYKPVRVARVQAYARFVQYIHRPDQGTAQSRHQVYPLAFAAGQCVRSPVQCKV